jgi:flavodoxin I
MAKVGLFYGSTTGKTEAAAEAIQAALGGENVVELHEISDVSEELADYDCLIIGCPTWDVGELQSDWEGFVDDELTILTLVVKKLPTLVQEIR